MIAGDVAVQTEAVQEVASVVGRRVQDEPDNWWNVGDVASLYSEAYNRARLKRAANKVLAPLGLNAGTFLQWQQQMDPALLLQLASDMKSFYSPQTSVIFAGIDPTGPHVYVANNSDITCKDYVGFAAIGAGDWHANSQFMFNGHTVKRPFPETLLLTYSAKRHAQVAPGVGEATDMFIIGPQLGTYLSIGDHVLEKLARIYRDSRKRLQRVAQQAEKDINSYVEELRAAAIGKPQGEISESQGEHPETELDAAV